MSNGWSPSLCRAFPFVWVWNFETIYNLMIRTRILNKHGTLAHHPIILTTQASGSKALNEYVSRLYHGDLWIPKTEAKAIVHFGSHFLKVYSFLAWSSSEKGEPKFGLKPKLHMFHEILEGLKRSLCNDFSYNVLAETCSQDEDFVGRLAYISRHVSPRMMAMRSLERYLTQVKLAWSESEVVGKMKDIINIFWWRYSGLHSNVQAWGIGLISVYSRNESIGNPGLQEYIGSSESIIWNNGFMSNDVGEWIFEKKPCNVTKYGVGEKTLLIYKAKND